MLSALSLASTVVVNDFLGKRAVLSMPDSQIMTDPNFLHADSAETEFQFLTISRIVRQHLPLIIVLTLVGAILGLALSKLSPKRYTATATIEVTKEDDRPLAAKQLTGVPQQFGSAEEMAAVLLTEEAEIQSEKVAALTISNLNLQAETPFKGIADDSSLSPAVKKGLMVDTFQANCKVDLLKDTKILEISYTDTNAERAAQIANGIVQAYKESFSEVRTVASKEAETALSKQLSQLRQEVNQADQNVADFQRFSAFVAPISTDNDQAAPAENVENDRYIELSKELTAAQINLTAKQTAYDSMTTTSDIESRIAAAGVVSAGTARAQGIDLSELVELHRQKVQNEEQIATDANTYGANSKTMIALKAKQNTIASLTRNELESVRARAAGELRLAQAMVHNLQNQVEKQRLRVAEGNANTNNLQAKQSEANSKRAIFRELSIKLDQARYTSGSTTSNITIVDFAHAPLSPSSPKTLRNTAIGILTGLSFGVFLAFWLNYLRATQRAAIL